MYLLLWESLEGVTKRTFDTKRDMQTYITDMGISRYYIQQLREVA